MKKSIAFLIILFAWLASCKHEIINPGGVDSHPDSTGTGPNGKICFETDVLPIFQGSCAVSNCHNANSASEGYVLDSYVNIVRKGIERDAAHSKIYKVLFESGDKFMPRSPVPPLTAEQKARIAQWINEGALNTSGCATNTCDTTHFNFAANVKPILNTYCTSCHNTVGAAINGGVDLSSYAGVSQHTIIFPL